MSYFSTNLRGVRVLSRTFVSGGTGALWDDARGFRRTSVLLLAFLLATAWPLQAAKKKGPKSAPVATTSSVGPFSWENALVTLNATTKQYSYQQPWVRSERKVRKTGVIVAGQRIITTAEDLSDATLIRVQKQGAGPFFEARLEWIDYQTNLAAFSVADPKFWPGLQAAKLADPVPSTGAARILRWDGDQLDDRRGEIARYTVDNSALSFVSVPVLRLNATVPGAGDGEAVVTENQLLGLVSQGGSDSLVAVPSSLVAAVVQAHARPTEYAGLGYFDFTWDTVDNPLCLAYLKLPGEPRGVIVKETGLKPGLPSLLKPRDILLSIDGLPIDNQGNYPDPQYKRLVLENLSSKGKWAGATTKFKIWRDGKEQEILYTLPKADYTDELVPSQSFDRSPEYVLVGGLVFTPLTEAYLRSWGGNWRQSAPFRLLYYDNGKIKPDRLQRVVLSQILPDAINLGYENLRHTVLDSINGVKISQISDIPGALQTPQNGFDVFTFAPGEAIGQAVIDAGKIIEANRRIMTNFHIARDRVLNSPMPALPEPAPSNPNPGNPAN